MPDDLTVLDDLADAVERNPSGQSCFVHDFKCVRPVFWERDLLWRNPDNRALMTVKVTYFKPPSAKPLVPADAAEQFVDGGHKIAGRPVTF